MHALNVFCFRVKFGVPLKYVCADHIPGSLLVSGLLVVAVTRCKTYEPVLVSILRQKAILVFKVYLIE